MYGPSSNSSDMFTVPRRRLSADFHFVRNINPMCCNGQQSPSLRVRGEPCGSAATRITTITMHGVSTRNECRAAHKRACRYYWVPSMESCNRIGLLWTMLLGSGVRTQCTHTRRGDVVIAWRGTALYVHSTFMICTTMVANTSISRRRCVATFVYGILWHHVFGNACMAGLQAANVDTTMFSCEFLNHAL